MLCRVEVIWDTEAVAGNKQSFPGIEAPVEEDAEVIVKDQITADALTAGDPVARFVSVRSYGTLKPIVEIPDQTWSCESTDPGCTVTFDAPRMHPPPFGWGFHQKKRLCPSCVVAYVQAYDVVIEAALPWNQPPP